ncbi:hypothetical protein [Streptomyces sp. NPDC014656]|uniref:hypothetical protein n=1 Tax=Streptomyces sp. NPDC014656 TaxID=3364878 RepID=UPI00370231F7
MSDRKHREKDERTAVFGWASVLALALAGAALGFLAVWTAEAVAPVDREHAVAVRVTDLDGDGHERYGYDLEARTTDGRTIPLAGGSARVDRVRSGEPVVVTLSRATGRPLAVRHVEGEANLHHHTGAVVLVVAAGLFAAAVAWRRRPLLRAASAVLPFAPRLLAAAVTVAALVLAGAAPLDRDPADGSRSSLDGMGIYRDPAFFPDRVVGVGTEAEVDDMAVTVRAPAATVAPAPGAGTALRVVAVPVVVRGTGQGTGTHLPVVLIGEGEGDAQLLRWSRCGEEPGALDDTFAPGETTGRLCFAVPQRFDPRYLVLERGGASVAVDVRGGTAAGG